MKWRAYQSLQQVAELDHHFLSYVDRGRGRPVVLLHGAPTWGFLWSGLLQELGETHRVLVPDLLGYGGSDRVDGVDRSVRRQAELLDRWLQKLEIERTAVVGHDLGGAVAMHLAARYPHRVSRLGLLDAACYDSWPAPFLHRLGRPERRPIRPAREAAHLRQALRRGFASPPPAAFLDGLLAPYRTEVGMRTLRRDAAALDPNETLELAPILGKIASPTLIAWGEADSFQAVDYAERLAWDIPDSRLTRIDGAGHFVMIDQPGRLMRVLQPFLAEEGSGPPSAVTEDFDRRAS